MTPFVYFDVGGVATQDFSKTDRWTKLKRELGIGPDKDEKFEEFFDEEETKVCLGLDVDALMPVMVTSFGAKIPKNFSLLTDGFVKRFEKNEFLWPLIVSLKKQYPVGLLTNMYPRMLEEIESSGLLPPVTWDAVIDSSVEKLAKPDPAIFGLAEERASATKENIFYVDNNQTNTEAADKLGWKTFLYDSVNYEASTEALETWFSRNGLL